MDGITLIACRHPANCDRRLKGNLSFVQAIQRSMTITLNEAALNSLNTYNRTAAIAKRSYTLYVMLLAICSGNSA